MHKAALNLVAQRGLVKKQKQMGFAPWFLGCEINIWNAESASALLENTFR